MKRAFTSVPTAWDICPRPWEHSFGASNRQASSPHSVSVQLPVQLPVQDSVPVFWVVEIVNSLYVSRLNI